MTCAVTCCVIVLCDMCFDVAGADILESVLERKRGGAGGVDAVVSTPPSSPTLAARSQRYLTSTPLQPGMCAFGSLLTCLRRCYCLPTYP